MITSRWFRTAAVVIAVAGVGASLLPGHPAFAAEPPSLGQISLVPQGQPDGYFKLDLAPGQRAGLTIARVNRGTVTSEATTYVADAFTIVNGGFGAKAQGSDLSKMSSWISYPAESLSLRAGEQNMKAFTVTVPAATKPGDYLSSIVLETGQAGTPDESSMVINHVTRQAIAVSVHVPGAYAPALTSSGVIHTLDSSNRSVISVGVGNPGNRNLKPTATLTVSTLAGVEVSTSTFAMGSFYAHDTTRVTSTLAEALNPGQYLLTFSLTDAATGATTSLDNEEFTVEPPATASIPDQIIAQLPAVVQDALRENGPWPVIGVIALLLGLAACWFIAIRRRRSRRRRTVEAAAAVAVAAAAAAAAAVAAAGTTAPPDAGATPEGAAAPVAAAAAEPAAAAAGSPAVPADPS